MHIIAGIIGALGSIVIAMGISLGMFITNPPNYAQEYEQTFGASVFTIKQGGTGSTTAPISQLLYGGATAYQSVATGTISAGAGITLDNSTRAAVGGALQITSSLGTSVDISSETNLTAGDGLTLTDDDLDCDTASASVFGCLLAANFISFNNKWDLASTSIAYQYLTLTNSLLEADLKAVDAAGDEEVLTFETTTGDFEWETCTEITGGAGLCDGTDADSGAGTGSNWQNSGLLAITPTTTVGILVNASSTINATTTIGGFTNQLAIVPKILKVGNITEHDFVPTGGDNSAFLILDKPNAASDASVLLSSTGDEKWEIGMAGDSNLFWKKVRGTLPTFTYETVLKMDYDTLRVGIGTEDPSSKLEIASTSPLARVDLRVTNKATSGTDGTSLQLVAENDNHVLYLGTDAGLNGGQNGFLNWGSFGTGIFMESTGKIGVNTTTLGFGDITVSGASTTNITASNATSTNLNVSSFVDFDAFTSALLLTGAGGILAEYAGASCTNQAVTAVSALGALTCTTLTPAYLDMTAAWDFGGATSLEIPNGTNPTVDAIGEIALDTTQNDLLVATSTAAGAPMVIKPFEWKGFTFGTSTQGMGSTTKTWFIAPPNSAGYMDGITCHASSTAPHLSFMRVVLRDEANNRTEDLIASTTETYIKLTTNAAFTAGEVLKAEIGTTTAINALMEGACMVKIIYTRS